MAEIRNYGSSSFRRVTRSIMASDIHALVHGLDFSYVTRDTFVEVIGGKISINDFVDRKIVFDIIVRRMH